MFDFSPDLIAGIVFVFSVIGFLGMAHRATLRTTDADGEQRSYDLSIDEDADPSEQIEQVERYAETREEAARADLQADLNEAEQELSAMRDLVVSDIIRRQKLAGEIGEDQDLSIEDQREYLEALPAERLKMEYERAPDSEDLSGSTATQTTGDDPDDTTAEFGEAVDELSA